MIPSGMAQPPDPHELYLHVRVLVGVVLGLGLTRILSGLARMVEHPGRNPVSATHLLWVAHNLERIADRVTNICERIVFAVVGEMEEINVSTY